MKNFVAALLVLLVSQVPAPAQSRGSRDQDAAQVTQVIKAKRLDITVTYRAIRWPGDTVESLRSETNADRVRRRINEAAARKPLGSFITKQDLLLGGRRIQEGIYDLWLSVDEDLGWHLVVAPKRRRNAVPLDFPLVSPPNQEMASRLAISLLPGDDVNGGELRIHFGRQYSRLAIMDASKTTAALTELRKFIAAESVDTGRAGWKTSLRAPPKLEFAGSDTYFWNLTTNVGPIVIKLLPQAAPMHVSSTMYLTELGFYDDLVFHRVIPDFMAQGGCPLGTGTGGPGYEYDGEFDPDVVHDRPGMLSMANSGPGTDGSQFFLTFVATPHLDGKHSIFGEVVQGMDTVEKLEAKGSRTGGVSSPLTIESAVITVQ
jgi:cyclophilin family peptidyl-prolyl cis-trans isomerase